MDINDVYGNADLIKASDLLGKEWKLRIQAVEPIQFDDGKHKLKATLAGCEKKWIINWTNAQAISAIFGGDTDNWLGKDVVLFSMKVQGPNGIVDAVRCRVPGQMMDAQAPMQQASNGLPASAQVNRPVGGMGAQAMPAAEPTGAFNQDLDDEIPF